MKKLILVLFLIYSFFSFADDKKVNAMWYNVYQINLANIKEAKSQIDLHFRAMNEMGINTVFFMVKSPNGRAYYNSKILKPVLNNDFVSNKNSENRFDVLEYVIKKSKEYNMEIYPYINVFAEQGYYLDENPKFAEKDSKGKIYSWTSPAIEDVQNRALSIIEEIIKNYNVNGIQLDRIRYEDTSAGFNEQSVISYKSAYGKDPSVKDKDFTTYRKQLITDFVKKAVSKVKSINPNMKVSVAVFHSPKTAENVLQDFGNWINIDGLDAIYTMSYTNKVENFKQFLTDNSALIENNNSTKTKIIIGVGSYYVNMTPEILMEQVKLAVADKNISGICYFSAYNMFEDSFYNMFKNYRP